jgi:hypothetical protein
MIGTVAAMSDQSEVTGLVRADRKRFGDAPGGACNVVDVAEGETSIRVTQRKGL